MFYIGLLTLCLPSCRRTLRYLPFERLTASDLSFDSSLPMNSSFSFDWGCTARTWEIFGCYCALSAPMHCPQVLSFGALNQIRLLTFLMSLRQRRVAFLCHLRSLFLKDWPSLPLCRNARIPISRTIPAATQLPFHRSHAIDPRTDPLST